MGLIDFNYTNKETYNSPASDYIKHHIDLEDFSSNYFTKKLFASNSFKTIVEDYGFIKNNEDSKEKMLIKFKREFRKIAENEELEFGKIGITTELVKKYLEKDKDIILHELQSIGLENIEDKNLIYALIHTFAHIDYELVFPAGPVFALAICGVHKDIEIKDYAIQSFEIWNNKSSLGYLKSINVDIPWLKEYLDEVILEIEES